MTSVGLDALEFPRREFSFISLTLTLFDLTVALALSLLKSPQFHIPFAIRISVYCQCTYSLLAHTSSYVPSSKTKLGRLSKE